jgi:hypothetical protein
VLTLAERRRGPGAPAPEPAGEPEPALVA